MKNSFLKFVLPICLATSGLAQAENESGGLRLGMIHCCVESDTFMWSIANNIRQSANADGNQIVFINAEGDQSKQLQALNQLKNDDIDALIMSIVIDDTLEKPFQQQLIDALKQTDLPVVFYLLAVENRFLDTYPKAYRVGSIPAQSGIMQGEMVSDAWLSHPQWDKNGDGIMQYALLKGPAGNPDAEGRTKWIRATLATFPTGAMQSEEVAFDTANWDRKQAQQITSSWIADGTANNIEVLIANNDDMMLGALDAFTADPTINRPALFGIDALPETLNLIREGEVDGTVQQDTRAQAESAYRLAANLGGGKNAANAIDFPIARQELIIPYLPVTAANVNNINQGGAQ